MKRIRAETAIGWIASVSLAAVMSGGCEDYGTVVPCSFSVFSDEVTVKDVEAVDLLFVIDDSDSMKEQQPRLAKELSRMITVLASGDLNPDYGVSSGKDFRGVKDLHLAVVTADMGLRGVNDSLDPGHGCGELGDDGAFVQQGNRAGDPLLTCAGAQGAGYPPFLSFQVGDDIEGLADDFGCLGALGAGGCSFPMPLEAALKALWPGDPKNLSEEQEAMNIGFFAGAPGLGDRPHAEFLRGTAYHPTQPEELSLLVIVVITGGEDCSPRAAGRPGFLEPAEGSGPAVIGGRPPSRHCYYDDGNASENDYTVDRYVKALKALRPGYEQLVVFAAVAGVPPQMRETDFDANADAIIDDQERNAYYEALLGDPSMQYRLDEQGEDLEPVCTLENPDPAVSESEPFVARAYPSRRVAEVVRGFGENGTVISICQEHFTEALGVLMEPIPQYRAGICLPRELHRDAEGMVQCEVTWVMPPGQGCGGLHDAYSSEPEADRPQETEDGRAICMVRQAPVIHPETGDPESALEPDAQGWYYDDFSEHRRYNCSILSFKLTPGWNADTEYVPSGVTVRVQCLQGVETGAAGGQQPDAGGAC